MSVRPHLALLLSGFAGLVWQALWVRQLSLVLGSTTEAVTIVTAVFLLGLGVGAHFGGKAADRAGERAPRLYAACEGGVASWGLALMPALTMLASHGIGTAAPDANGWWVPTPGTRLVQLALALAALGPPTLLMGASLPLLAPTIVGDRLDRSGWRLGTAVAANTAGAALGALATDLVCVPALGLRGTGMLAAVLGATAGWVAWRSRPISDRPADPADMSRISGDAAAISADPRHPGPPVSQISGDAAAMSVDPRHSPAILFTAATAGFAAMGMEVVWFRFLGGALGPYRAVFAMLLFSILTGWLVGSLLSGALSLRVRPAAGLAALQAAVPALMFLGLYAHDPRALLLHQLAGDASPLSQHLVNLQATAAVVFPAAVAMGAVFPLASALVQDELTRVGRRAGALWFATTAGNAAGALLTGLVLLPGLGMQHAALLLGSIAAIAPLGLVRQTHLAAPATLAGLAASCLFAALPADTLLWASFPYGRAQDEGVLAIAEGRDETVVVTGSAEGPARLWTNGHPMSSTTPHAQRYMRLMAHLPLLAQADPHRALVICFGVGNTLHAASLHPLDRLDLADLSANVLGQAHWFSHSNHDILADPRVHVFVDDGRHVLLGQPPETWDLVTLEPPPIAHAGVSSLYSREFYTIAHQRLRPGGWITQWLPAYQVPEDTVRAIVGAFVEVFPDAVLLVGDGRELILAGVRDGVPMLDVASIDARLASNPAVASDLAAVGIGGTRDLAATFAGSALGRVAAAPITDDHPALEWAGVSHVMVTRLPPDLVAPESWPTFVPGYANDLLFATMMAENRARWTATDFQAFSNLPAK